MNDEKMADEYITKSNIQKLLLFNSLLCRPELKNLTIEQIKDLTEHCYVNLFNSIHDLKEVKLTQELNDDENIFSSFDQINKQILNSFIKKVI